MPRRARSRSKTSGSTVGSCGVYVSGSGSPVGGRALAGSRYGSQARGLDGGVGGLSTPYARARRSSISSSESDSGSHE
eukprot:15446425-Alexandrium_andersonii.AAC.1